jgi:hypothetical protein
MCESCDVKSYGLEDPSSGPGANPVSYPMGINYFSQGVERPERESVYCPPSSAEVKSAWSFSSTP